MGHIIHDTLQPLEILVQIILQKYLNDSYCVNFIMEQDLDLKISHKSAFVKFDYIDNEEDFFNITLTASEMGCSDYVVRISEPEIFMQTFELITHLGNTRRSDRKIILLPSFKDNEANLLNVLKIKETTYIPNILLVIPVKSADQCESYDLITHKFVGPDLEVHDPIYLDKWNGCTEKFKTNVNLFPYKMNNLQGKTVIVAGFQQRPFTILDLDEKVTVNGRDGIDVKTVDELCAKINCKVKILRDDPNAWGHIFNNKTGIGAMGNVFEDRADLAISGYGAWYDTYKHLDYSSYGVQCDITCIAPAPKIRSKWEMPFLPFHRIMWLIMALLSVYCCLTLKFAQYSSSEGVVFLTYRIMVSQAQFDYKNVNWKVRKITCWILITYLLMNSAYGAGMATTFTIPKYEKSVDTIQDLIDRGMPWSAVHEAYTYSLLTSDEPKTRKLVSLFHKYEPVVLKEKLRNQKIAYSVIKIGEGSIAIDADFDIIRNYMMMLEDFYSEQSHILGRKCSPILDKLSQLMLRLHEVGLYLAWENQVALKYLDYKVQLAVKLSRTKTEASTEPLGYKHVVGVFMIYLSGVGLSIIVFVREIVKGTKYKK